MGDTDEFTIGQTVQLPDGRVGIVQYMGGLHFAAGDFVGVELEDASGKNDGAVQGQRYFSCPSGHGMFVRPAAATIVSAPEEATPKAPPPKAAAPATNGAAKKPRPSSTAAGPAALRRQSVLDPAAKRRSINMGSPTPGPRASAVGPPAAGRSLRVRGEVTRLGQVLTCCSLLRSHRPNLPDPPPLPQRPRPLLPRLDLP